MGRGFGHTVRGTPYNAGEPGVKRREMLMRDFPVGSTWLYPRQSDTWSTGSPFYTAVVVGHGRRRIDGERHSTVQLEATDAYGIIKHRLELFSDDELAGLCQPPADPKGTRMRALPHLDAVAIEVRGYPPLGTWFARYLILRPAGVSANRHVLVSSDRYGSRLSSEALHEAWRARLSQEGSNDAHETLSSRELYRRLGLCAGFDREEFRKLKTRVLAASGAS